MGVHETIGEHTGSTVRVGIFIVSPYLCDGVQHQKNDVFPVQKIISYHLRHIVACWFQQSNAALKDRSNSLFE